MPAVGAAISAAVVKYAATFSISQFLISTAASLALSAISRAMAPKPKASSFSNAGSRGGVTQNVRQAITSHAIIYGQKRVGGPIVYVASSASNQILHMIIPVAAHEVEAIDEVWLNDTVIPNDYLNETGVVIAGRYSGYVRIRKYLGTTTQGADPLLVAEVPEWTAAHRLAGIAYVYAMLIYNQDMFPGGIPNISAVVRGKKIYDPRSETEKFTTNGMLYAYDFLKSEQFGMETPDSRIDLDAIEAGANISDEFVTTSDIPTTVSVVNDTTDIITLTGTRLRYHLGDRVTIASTGSLPTGLSAATNYYVIPYQFKDTVRIKLASSFDNAMAYTAINLTSAGSGTMTITKNAEPRYHGAGVLDVANEIQDNLLDILSCSGAKAIYAGGVWKVLPAAYYSPTVTLDEDDFIGPLKIQTKLSRRDRFNLIRGVFSSSLNDWQPTDYPAMSDSAAIGRDGQEIGRDYDLPFTNREFCTQRLAKIELKKAVQDIVVKARCNLRAMQVQAGDTVNITNARMGWSSKPFEVTAFRFILGGEGDPPDLGVELTLRETASAIYDWDVSEESDIDVAPNTTLPNAFDVQAPDGVAFSSRRVETQGADSVFILVLQWNPSNDAFVVNEGFAEIQFKLSSEAIWRPSFRVSGSLSFSDVQQASVNTSYDLRIRFINNLGVRSSWVTILGATVGTSGGVGATNDWGLFSASVTTTNDWGDWTSTPTTFNDWETFT